jgi:uncharacterized glyoxalase superfamily protein PhnB
LTHKEALDFWRKNFNIQTDGKVTVEQFCEIIQEEFAETVFKAELDDLPEDINLEDLMQDFFSDMVNKVSID